MTFPVLYNKSITKNMQVRSSKIIYLTYIMKKNIYIYLNFKDYRSQYVGHAYPT